jgi:predicted metal-binding membrane protein
MTDTTVTEALLRRDRQIVLGGLAAITLLAWLYLLTGAGMGMSPFDMTAAALFPHLKGGMAMADGMEGMSMQAPAWATTGWALTVLMWWVMMMAMMTPSAAPAILLYARVHRHAQRKGQLDDTVVPTSAFAGGYILSWLAFSIAAATLQWALEQTGHVSATMMWSESKWLSASVLVAAGAYQLSPLKEACLRHCRSPAEFISRHWCAGRWGALRMGLEHGAYCVGCCWVLMALLFVGGIMNLLWIALLAAFVLVEKVVPRGAVVGRTTGVALVVWGLVTLFATA